MNWPHAKQDSLVWGLAEVVTNANCRVQFEIGARSDVEEGHDFDKDVDRCPFQKTRHTEGETDAGASLAVVSAVAFVESNATSDPAVERHP
ncbi:MAG TPA: hypothetical protein VMY37_00940 [Thermoguttaceae bacterium]|nr:hypothetical protein [Thermoguttaceae bacterium]